MTTFAPAAFEHNSVIENKYYLLNFGFVFKADTYLSSKATT